MWLGILEAILSRWILQQGEGSQCSQRGSIQWQLRHVADLPFPASSTPAAFPQEPPNSGLDSMSRGLGGAPCHLGKASGQHPHPAASAMAQADHPRLPRQLPSIAWEGSRPGCCCCSRELCGDNHQVRCGESCLHPAVKNTVSLYFKVIMLP